MPYARTDILQCPMCLMRPQARGVFLHVRKMHPNIEWNSVKDQFMLVGPSDEPIPASTGGAIRETPLEIESVKKTARISNYAKQIKVAELASGAILNIAPKAFTMTSSIVWQTKYITEAEWGWPIMEAGEWLDTYIIVTMAKMGVHIGGYVIAEDGPTDQMRRARSPGRDDSYNESVAPEQRIAIAASRQPPTVVGVAAQDGIRQFPHTRPEQVPVQESVYDQEKIDDEEIADRLEQMIARRARKKMEQDREQQDNAPYMTVDSEEEDNDLDSGDIPELRNE